MIRIAASARRDLDEGYDFYESQEIGLGDYFLSSVKADIESLKFTGGAHRIAHAETFGSNRLTSSAGSNCSISPEVALALNGYCGFSRERLQVRQRFDGMRQALRARDTNNVLQLIIPEVRTTYCNDLQRLLMLVGTGSNKPGVWMWAGKARVLLQIRMRWLGIVPIGNEVEMIRTNGDWFFTGRVFID